MEQTDRLIILASMPMPVAAGAVRPSDMVDLSIFDPRLGFDIRYARTDNFTSHAVYSKACAWMQREAAQALSRVHDKAHQNGLGLMIFDAYRPWHVTKTFWDEFPAYRDFVADPSIGSVHNRGCAVDLTLTDLATGEGIAMPSGYDEFTERAYPTYTGGDVAALANRDLLGRLMASEGFAVHPHEWWHFDFHAWREYPILNIDFENLA